jgi:hypothetical protein
MHCGAKPLVIAHAPKANTHDYCVRLRLSHKSATAASRCRILQRRRDIAGGADVDLAPRRWGPRRVRDRVGVLSNGADLCDSLRRKGQSGLAAASRTKESSRAMRTPGEVRDGQLAAAPRQSRRSSGARLGPQAHVTAALVCHDLEGDAELSCASLSVTTCRI